MTVLRGPGANSADQSGDPLYRRGQSCANNTAGVALALSGGFSRGFAHLGVLEILEQERIPIAAIAGTSIGSLLGAAYADGIPIHELCRLGRRVRIRDFIRFRKSRPEIANNDRIGQFIREWFHSTRVEELSIPTAIVTTDLDTCAPHIFTRGPLDVAIRATCAFPGLFQPVEHEGRRLADGCIVTPVPTLVAARMNASCVLGVAVGLSGSSASSSSNVVQVFSRYPQTSHNKKMTPSWTRQADVILEPEVQQIDWDDFSRVEEAHAAGAEAMRLALPYVRELLARRSPQRGAGETLGKVENRLVS
ncbi:MAG: patatin-like phospholipase family protein [Acidobacteriia bacterium]|nr:patatin-like phospholipase family protein [Terriglobia bacterium]